MSILQEYEKIKKDVGQEIWDSIEDYIDYHHPELFLSDIIYNKDNWQEFEKWFYKEKKQIDVNVLSAWETDYDDYKANIELTRGNNKLGNVIVSYAEGTIRYLANNLDKELTEKEIKMAFNRLALDDFESYLKLPIISKCSKLLQSIYDCVCQSDSAMCHITEDDWLEYYSNEYSQRDLDILENEINKYNLNDCVVIEEDGYKIVGYGDLETMFIDDRNIIIENNYESEMGI